MRFSTSQIAWRNLDRNRRRTYLAVAAIALGQMLFIFFDGVLGGLTENMLDTITGPFVGHVQVHAKDWREERAIDLCIEDLPRAMAEIRSLPWVKRVAPRIYSPALAAPEGNPGMVVVIGVDPGIESGERGMLEGVSVRPGGGRVLVGHSAAERLEVGEGDEIALIGQAVDGSIANGLYTVAAVISTQLDVVNSRGIVMSLADAQEFWAMEDGAHEIVVHGRSAERAAKLAEDIAGLPSLAGAEVLSWRDAVPELVTFIEAKGSITVLLLVLVFIAVAAGVANTMMMATFERTHEFGMLLAVGARPRRITWMVVVESLILGLTGVVAGSVIGASIVLILSKTGFNYAALGGSSESSMALQGVTVSFVMYPKLTLSHLMMSVAAVTVTSVLASLWPAALAARLEPAKAMRS